MIIEGENALEHYGILRKSGRYPWGSGDNSVQRSNTFLSMVADLRKEGMSDSEIAKAIGLETTTNLRNTTTIARNEKRAADISTVRRLSEKGMSNVAIGKQMGIPESTVRSLRKLADEPRMNALQATVAMLKDHVDRKGMIDVGTGVEHHIQIPGLSETKLKAAVAAMKDLGYNHWYVKIPQLGTKHETTHQILTKPEIGWAEANKNKYNIEQIVEFTTDGGSTWQGIQPPLSISSRRVGINYSKKNEKGEEVGGGLADGVIYVRPGVDDVSLGQARYAQVRIAVDGTHYIKGMAMYKDNLPPGVDLVFNTNKAPTKNKLDALKPMKTDKDGNIDQDNPFGSTIKPGGQRIEVSSTGKKKVTSVMNKVYEEGDWETWSRTLSSQFLSKQTPHLAKSQLDLTYENRKADLDEILQLTNPAVRKHLLEKFAEETDSAAVHLKAAQLPRQSNHVILPIPSLKENEIYAPTFKNGERVVLVRHPHGGTFEIPELVVNNKHPEGNKLLGDTQDAVGIHPKTAERLSGADFDGDTVLVIPNSRNKVVSTPALRDLKNFDPKDAYPPYDGMHTMDGGTYNAATKKVTYPEGKGPSSKTKQQQMGDVSNLITDMTIKAAPPSEIARAVRHSMVVIDAEKHNLNYKQSAIDNGISQLKKKYQVPEGNTGRGGASTIISQKKSELRVPERKQGFKINPVTGEKEYRLTNASYVDPKTNKVVVRTTKSTKLAEAKDAHTLSSGTKIEEIYADHSNRLKSMANEARLASVHTKLTPYNPSARTAFKPEVESLNSKLNLALRNRPLERQAQVVGNRIYKMKVEANPHMDETEKKKVRAQALAEGRTRTGAGKELIKIEPNEWQAIQAGALFNNTLTQVLDNADLEQVKSLATPKRNVLMTPTKTARAQSMLASGYTQQEVAAALGVSLTTLKRGIGGE